MEEDENNYPITDKEERRVVGVRKGKGAIQHLFSFLKNL